MWNAHNWLITVVSQIYFTVITSDPQYNASQWGSGTTTNTCTLNLMSSTLLLYTSLTMPDTCHSNVCISIPGYLCVVYYWSPKKNPIYTKARHSKERGASVTVNSVKNGWYWSRLFIYSDTIISRCCWSILLPFSVSIPCCETIFFTSLDHFIRLHNWLALPFPSPGIGTIYLISKGFNHLIIACVLEDYDEH